MRNPRSLTYLALPLLAFCGAAATADNVTISTISNDVVATGDSEDNEIQVQHLRGRRHRFTGLNGTMINGQFQSIELEIRDDLVFRMHDGDDFIDIRSAAIENVWHADLEINLGSGSDTVLMTDTNVQRTIEINGDAPPPRNRRTLPVFTRPLRVVLSNDVVMLEGVSFQDLELRTFGGHDSIEVLGCVGEAVEIEAQGSTLTVIDHNDLESLRLTTGSLGDRIHIGDNNITRGFGMDTGAGDDEVHFFRNFFVAAGPSANATLGAGNDLLRFHDNFYGDTWMTAGYPFGFFGGEGTDRMEGGALRWFSDPVRYYEFEDENHLQLIDTFFL
ncbi:MAG: hypothetical protein AAFU85_08515 [Planctomycetota bacterium]